MATNLTQLRQALVSPEVIRRDQFEILRDISELLASSETATSGQELLLRALDKRADFTTTSEILTALTRKVGLFPYLDTAALSFRDLLAYEAHRPAGLGDVVFHAVQARVYRSLMDGHNVVLSAPTSFGKSLIVDAVIASGRYNNVVVVVPTIALIDETRRRMWSRFAKDFKIITHADQKRGERNLYILTQERVLDRDDLDATDLFVIDEFYKLDPKRADDETRSIALNQAFYKLWKTGAQFYLLGPTVAELTRYVGNEGLELEAITFHTNYSTVAADVHKVTAANEAERLRKLVDLCQKKGEAVLIYTKSPAQANAIARALMDVADDAGKGAERAAEWARDNYHPEWTFAKALQHGIGIHHGRLPRAMAQYVVRAFNAGRLKYLICTSTLIEGVNTAAKTIMVYDHRIATQKYDIFTFNNIKGRAGRMFKHFVGDVYVFRERPKGDLPNIDLPLFAQDEHTAPEILLQMDDADLSPQARVVIQPLLDQAVLTVETLRLNPTFDPNAQIAVAQKLASDPEGWSRKIAWQGFPTFDPLAATCELLWDYLLVDQQHQAAVHSGRQLAFMVFRLYQAKNIKGLIQHAIAAGSEPDAAVEDSLQFLRHWTFHLPHALGALDRIQREIFDEAGVRAGDYSVFAVQLENQFVEPALLALEEFGLPLQISTRLRHVLQPGEGLDHVLSVLKRVPIPSEWTEFEKVVLRDVRMHL